MTTLFLLVIADSDVEDGWRGGAWGSPIRLNASLRATTSENKPRLSLALKSAVSRHQAKTPGNDPFPFEPASVFGLDDVVARFTV